MKAQRDSRLLITLATSDGAGQSGLVVLLNGPNGELHVANGVIAAAGVDLNSDEAALTYADFTGALKTFSLLEIPNLYLDASMLPSTPPIFVPPTPESTGEATAEATAEASEEATSEVTPEASEEPDATAEATEAQD